VVGLISGSVSAASRVAGHWISFGITLGMMLLVVAYMIYSLKKRRKLGWFRRYGPLICTIIAVPLIMADIFRHLLQDNNIWLECQRKDGEVWGPQCLWSSSQYRCNLVAPHGCIPDRQENLAHLSFIGVLFTIIFTYIGFVFLMVGSFWNANFLSKMRQVREKWKELRGF